MTGLEPMAVSWPEAATSHYPRGYPSTWRKSTRGLQWDYAAIQLYRRYTGAILGRCGPDFKTTSTVVDLSKTRDLRVERIRLFTHLNDRGQPWDNDKHIMEIMMISDGFPNNWQLFSHRYWDHKRSDQKLPPKNKHVGRVWHPTWQVFNENQVSWTNRSLG